MNAAALMRLDVEITNPGGPVIDDFGDPVSEATVAPFPDPDVFPDPDETPGDQSPFIVKGWYEQERRSEDTVRRSQESEVRDLYLAPEAAGLVRASATVRHGGDTFEIIGPPWTAIHPRTLEVTHVEATMKRVL